MNYSWLSKTSSGIANYLYGPIAPSGDEESDEESEVAQTSSSLRALSKGFWITDLPTNDYEPLENSPMAIQLIREEKLDLEAKIAALEAKFEEKEQQLKKAKFLAKGNFLKQRAEVEELSDELQSDRENERELEATNSSLRQQLQQLQGKLENSQLQEESEIARSCLSQTICELNNQLAACKSELAKAAAEKECIKAEVEAFKESEKNMEATNFSLQEQLQELQKKLDNSQLQKQLEIGGLNSQLAACKSELAKHATEKERIKPEVEAFREKEQQLKKAKKNTFLAKGNFLKQKAEVQKLSEELQSARENERELEATNSSLRQQLQELQEKLENSQLQEESEIARFRLSQKICELNDQLAACKSELAKDATEKECIKAEVEAFKENEKKMEATNFSLKEQLQELQKKLDNSQLQKESEICALNSQLTVCKSELAKHATEKERIKPEVEAFREKEQQLKKAKKNNFIAKGNFLKQKAEVEKLSEELQSARENKRELEATNSSLRQQLQQLQGKLENSQLQEESEIARSCLSQKICELNHQLAACKFELAKAAAEKECIKVEVEAFKENEKKMEAINFFLNEQLQELQKKLDNSQLQKQSEICALNSQLAACKSELFKDATEKECIKAEVEALKENEKKMEATNFSLKEQLQELQKKLDNSQLQKQSEICAQNSQLAACKSELAKDATEKECIKAELEALKENEKNVEATNFSLKEQLQELQKKLDNSQLQKQSEICGLNSQLTACKSELAKRATEKEWKKAEVEAFKVRKCAPPPTVPLYNPPNVHFGKEDTATASLTTQLSKASHDIKPLSPPLPPAPIPLFNPLDVKLGKIDALPAEQNSTNENRRNPYRKSANVRKCAPLPTVPLFNPPNIQLGKEDTATASLTAQPNLRSKASHDIKPLPPPLPPAPIPLFNPFDIALEKKDPLPAEQNSINENRGNPYRKSANARDVKPVPRPLQPPQPPSPIPLFNPRDTLLGRKDAIQVGKQNSLSKQNGKPYRKSANVRDIKPVEPPAQPRHPTAEEGANPFATAANGKGFLRTPQYMQHPQSFSSVNGESFAGKNANPFSHIASHDIKPFSPPLPPTPIPLFNPLDVELGKIDPLPAEQNSINENRGNPYRKSGNARDVKPVPRPLQPPQPPSPIPLFNPRDTLLGRKDAIQVGKQNSLSKQNGKPYRKSANVRDIKPVEPPAQPHHPTAEEGGNPFARAANGKGFPRTPQYMQHPQSFSSVNGESFAGKNANPFSHIASHDIKPFSPPLPPTPIPLFNPLDVELGKIDPLPAEQNSINENRGNPYRKSGNARDVQPVLRPPLQPPLPPSPIPLFNPRDTLLGRKDAIQVGKQNSLSKQNGKPYRKSANVRDIKPVEPPAQPHHPTAEEGGNPFARAANGKGFPRTPQYMQHPQSFSSVNGESFAGKNANPFSHIASHDIKPFSPPLPPTPIPLFNPLDVELGKIDPLPAEQNSINENRGNPYRKSGNARDVQPVLRPPLQPPLPPSPIPLFNPRDTLLGRKDAIQVGKQNSLSKQNGKPYRKSANVRDIKPVEPPAQPHHPTAEEGGNPFARAANGKGFPRTPQYMQHPQSFSSVNGESFAGKNANPFSHIEERGFLRRSFAWLGF